ncbi:hypothetical protein LJR074_002582 [Acidovorax sp. LjRoot74]|uniref:hypothetical protein n=1 Tax=Acidovorax sp. LjRoot74 TaxID=3342337 RepID=UPI003ED15F77
MNESEMQRLSFANTVRTLAQELRQEAKQRHMATFCKLNARPSESGKMYEPMFEVQDAAAKSWLEGHPLDSFIPAALAELRRIDKLTS